jgi:hypothetical protein
LALRHAPADRRGEALQDAVTTGLIDGSRSGHLDLGALIGAFKPETRAASFVLDCIAQPGMLDALVEIAQHQRRSLSVTLPRACDAEPLSLSNAEKALVARGLMSWPDGKQTQPGESQAGPAGPVAGTAAPSLPEGFLVSLQARLRNGTLDLADMDQPTAPIVEGMTSDQWQALHRAAAGAGQRITGIEFPRSLQSTTRHAWIERARQGLPDLSCIGINVPRGGGELDLLDVGTVSGASPLTIELRDAGSTAAPLVVAAPLGLKVRAIPIATSNHKGRIRYHDTDMPGRPQCGPVRTLPGLVYLRRSADAGLPQLRSKTLNLNCEARFPDDTAPEVAGKPIECRHLAIQWLDDRARFHDSKRAEHAAADSKRFSFAQYASVEAIAAHVMPSERRHGGPRSIVRVEQFGELLQQHFAQMAALGVPLRLMSVSGFHHRIACELRVRETVHGKEVRREHVLNIYDPNRTTTYLRLVLDEPGSLNGALLPIFPDRPRGSASFISVIPYLETQPRHPPMPTVAGAITIDGASTTPEGLRTLAQSLPVHPATREIVWRLCVALTDAFNGEIADEHMEALAQAARTHGAGGHIAGGLCDALGGGGISTDVLRKLLDYFLPAAMAPEIARDIAANVCVSICRGRGRLGPAAHMAVLAEVIGRHPLRQHLAIGMADALGAADMSEDLLRHLMRHLLPKELGAQAVQDITCGICCSLSGGRGRDVPAKFLRVINEVGLAHAGHEAVAAGLAEAQRKAVPAKRVVRFHRGPPLAQPTPADALRIAGLSHVPSTVQVRASHGGTAELRIVEFASGEFLVLGTAGAPALGGRSATTPGGERAARISPQALRAYMAKHQVGDGVAAAR